MKKFNIRAAKQMPFSKIDKLFMVTDFNFGALDRGKFFTGIGYAADQRTRGENYENYLNSALNNPRCIGAHWYTYCDSPTGGRTMIAENANCGLVSSSDTPYPEMIDSMRSVSQNMYLLRSNKASGTE